MSPYTARVNNGADITISAQSLQAITSVLKKGLAQLKYAE